MHFKTIRDIDLNNKTVLLRADLNVPAAAGRVSDFTRIDRLRDTVAYLHAQGAKIVVMSHFGRPKDGPSDEFSLGFLAPLLQERWACGPVDFVPDCIGAAVKARIAAMKGGDILLLENVRFHKGEEKNDPAFAAALAEGGDVYVNDAFSSAHRAHASTEGLAHLLPHAAGFLMEAELNALSAALEKPQRPLAAIVGGAKISTKLDLLNNLVARVDMLVLGGGMANTFLHARGVDLKASLCEREMKDQALAIMDRAAVAGCAIILPVDVVWADAFAAQTAHGVCAVESIPDGKMALDIGPASVEMICTQLAEARTLVWNGPAGAFEIQPFDAGTVALARFVAAQTDSGACISVAGGGDTVAALEQAGVAARMSYVSTAGGAFLEWMEGKTLPGVAALMG